MTTTTLPVQSYLQGICIINTYVLFYSDLTRQQDILTYKDDWLKKTMKIAENSHETPTIRLQKDIFSPTRN